MPGQRIRELIAPLGFDGGKTIVDDYLREVRPLFVPPRTYQRTVYRPGEICQFDLWEPQGRDPGRPRPDPRGLGRRRLPGLLARRRRRVGVLQADPGAVVRDPALSVVAGRAAGDVGLGPPVRPARRRRAPDGGVRRASAGSCGSAGTSARRATRRPRASSSACRTSSSASFEPGRVFANELDYQLQLDAWFDERANARMHKTLRARPIDRLIEERAVMAPLPAARAGHRSPLGAARPAGSLPALRYLRLLARPRAWSAGASRPASPSARSWRSRWTRGELACRHPRSFARHRTITALEHARTLKAQRDERRDGEPVVEVRSLARYDQLIA